MEWMALHRGHAGCFRLELGREGMERSAWIICKITYAVVSGMMFCSMYKLRGSRIDLTYADQAGCGILGQTVDLQQ